nr:hypothetical transcript [Hymenolepis microstoma]
MSDGPFLYSDMTIESPEFKKKPPSLYLSCQSSNTSLKSVGSIYDAETVSIHSEESGGFKRGSDSGTVILCSNRDSHSSSFTMEEESQSMKSASQTIRSDYETSWSVDVPSKGSRLDQVLERIFVQVLPEGDIKINHLACLAHIQKVICESIRDAQILVFNCQEPDPSITEMFEKVYDCCFDLNARPDIESFIRFCEICYDWQAQSSSHVIILHSESSSATKRLLLLLFAYASFCDSVERQNIRTNRRLKAYLSTYPNGNTSVPTVYLRYAAYMKIFSPFRRQSISRATMSIHSIVLHNCPLFADHSVNIFLKIYSYSPLRHVYTTCVHNISGRLSDRAVLLFVEEPITVRGDVVILCYRLNHGRIERRRVFKLLFHSCEGNKDMLTFNYDAFDEISDAVPVTFKLVLNLVPKPEELIDGTNQRNFFIENAKDVRTKDNQSSPLSNCIESVNIIESRNASIEAIRLSDSLEDIIHVPNRSILLATSQELEEITRELAKNRSQTFNEYFMNAFGTFACEQQWSLQTPKKRKAPKRPPPPDPQRVKTLRESDEASWNTNCGTLDRCSIDSGASLHSDSSDMSERSLKRLAMPALKRLKKRIKSVIDMKDHKKPSKQSKSLVDAELMPPPTATTVPRSKFPAKSVVFLNATPTKIPPPRPKPPNLTSMEVVGEVRERQGKTPSGVRSVPTKYFGPQEKYQKLSEKDSSGSRLLNVSS